MYINPYTFLPSRHAPRWTWTSLLESMALSGLRFCPMKSTSSSQCLTSVYKVWSHLGARTLSFPYDTQRITTMKVEFDNSGRLLLTCLLACSPRSITGCLLPRLSSFLASWILLAHFFEIISTHGQWIHSTLPKWTNGSQFSKVFKESATAVSLWMGPSRTCSKWIWLRIMVRCFLSRNPATLTFFHSSNAL